MGIFRLILALSVVFWHIPSHRFVIFNGGIAVEAFFIISGFYMAFVINEKYSQLKSNMWISKFYASRALRLAPVYLIACIIEGAFYLRSNTPNIFSANDLSVQARITLFFLNFFIIGQDLWASLQMLSSGHDVKPSVQSIVTFFGAASLNPIYIYIGQAWSLSAELFFYLLAPFIVLSRKRVMAVFIVFLALRFYFLGHPDIYPNAPWRSRLFITNLPIFLLGVMSYWIYQVAKDHKSAKAIGYILALGGILSLVIFNRHLNGILLFPGEENYDELRIWGFYIVTLVTIPFLFIAFKNSKLDAYIGEVSYPLYIIHGFLLGFLSPKLNVRFNPDISAIILLTVIISFSYLLYLFVDGPMDKLRHKILSNNNGSDTHHIAPKLFGPILVIPTLLIYSLFQPTILEVKVPYLIKTVGKYNIVKYGQDFWGAPQGIDIHWKDNNFSLIEGMIHGDTEEQVENKILSHHE